MKPLSPEERQALEDVAADLGIRKVNDLYALILFESRWDPQAKNPTSSARGLIQFMNATAQNMGYYSSLDLVTQYPDRESQLRGPVLDYLRPGSPFNSLQELCMEVFMPSAKRWPGNRPFSARVRAANPGINCPNDYVARVRARANAEPDAED